MPYLPVLYMVEIDCAQMGAERKNIIHLTQPEPFWGLPERLREKSVPVFPVTGRYVLRLRTVP